MPPIQPDSLASRDQATAISGSVAANVIWVARFATNPDESRIVALADPPRASDGSPKARAPSIVRLIVLAVRLRCRHPLSPSIKAATALVFRPRPNDGAAKPGAARRYRRVGRSA